MSDTDALLGLSEQEAALMADEANTWYSILRRVRPTEPSFTLRLEPVAVNGRTEQFVRIMVGTITGGFVVSVPAANAAALGEALIQYATLARTGLVTASAVAQ